jgi:hypothetical protein
MAIATTSSYNPDVGDIVEEAFELCGLESRTGNDIRTARRSLSLLTLEWQNKGINLWTIDSQSVADTVIVAGTADYDLDIDTISILDAVIRTDAGSATLQRDYVIEPMSQATYSQIPNKMQTGRPLQYWYQRTGVRDVAASTDRAPVVTLWPIPDLSSKYTFEYWRMRRIADPGDSAANTMEIPDRFLPALIYGLAAKLSFKKAMDRFQFLEGNYEALFAEAAEEDRTKETMRIVPDLDPYRNR